MQALNIGLHEPVHQVGLAFQKRLARRERSERINQPRRGNIGKPHISFRFGAQGFRARGKDAALHRTAFERGEHLGSGASIDCLPFELWSIPSIKQPEQLKGTKLGISRIGATTDFVARYLLQNWGLQPEKDVPIFQAGAGPQVFAALKGGAVQSGILSTRPETLRAEAEGYVRLADVSASGLVYPFGPFAARQAFLKSQPNLVNRLMKAYVEGLHRFTTDKALALATLEK